MKIGEKVKKLRLEQGLTRKELAARTGGVLKAGGIQSIERGLSVSPRHEAAVALAHALGVSLEELTDAANSVDEPRTLHVTLPPGVKLTAEDEAAARRIFKNVLDELSNRGAHTPAKRRVRKKRFPE